MRIGVVSDTHGHVAHTRAAIELLRLLNVERVLHCGDIGSATIARLFADWPTDFVFGNCDLDRGALTEAITAAGQTCHGDFAELRLADRTIALLHGDDARQFREVTRSARYDLVCYGHSHVAKHEICGSTLVLNPGALYRAQPLSFAVVDLATLAVTPVAL